MKNVWHHLLVIIPMHPLRHARSFQISPSTALEGEKAQGRSQNVARFVAQNKGASGSGFPPATTLTVRVGSSKTANTQQNISKTLRLGFRG